jgi:hypothetical protein
VTLALNAVNETDQRLGINDTHAFPVLNVDVSPAGNIHFFGGVDGDVVRNTLRSLLSENRWLAPNVVLANTIKSYDIYGGSKGQLGNGFSFEAKASFARYRNFYTFNNSLTDTTKFFALYDGGITQVLTLSGQLGYELGGFRSTLRGDVFRYDLDRLEEAWGRPRASVQWLNSYTFQKKLFVTSDLYVHTGIRNKNFSTGTEIIQLPAIADLNLKIDYFLGRQVAAFVSFNNIFGQSYQRYLYYRVQGFNFLGGISYSF